MKVHQLILILAVVAAGAQAHAIHAYRTETCKTTVGGKTLTIKRSLEDNVAFIKNSGDSDGVAVIYQGLRLDADDESSATGKEDIELNILSETDKQSSSYDDGCLIGEEGTLKRSVDIQKISKVAAKVLSLKAKQNLQLSCEFEDVVPMGNGCNQ